MSTVNVNDNRRGWERLLNQVEGMDGAYVKVGVLEDAGGGERADGDLTLPEIAALHEYGDPDSGLPERSFIRKTFIDQALKVQAFTGRLVRQVAADKLDAARALDLLGAMAAGEIKLTITRGRVGGPPLAEATIKRKGSSKPLIDTGTLVNYITWEVVA
jgi:hypothetical protein